MEARKSKFKSVTQVRPDSKGRVTLSKLANGISSFNVSQDADKAVFCLSLWLKSLREKSGCLITLKHSVKRGISDAKAGRVKSLGSFAKFVHDEDKSLEL